jgi:MFS family permease
MLSGQKNLSRGFQTILSLPATGMGFALSVQISALSVIMSQEYGFAIHEVGLVWAAGPLAGIIGQPIIGLISDKVWFWGGRRKPFILIGGILTALALLALPNVREIASFLGIEELLGIAAIITLMLDLSINISFNPTRSIVADVTPNDHRRTQAYTWMQVVSGTFGVGAYLIGVLIGQIELVYTGAFVVLGCSLIPPFFIEEPRSLEDPEEEGGSSESFSTSETLMTLLPLGGYLIYAIIGIVSEVSWRVQGLHEAPERSPMIEYGVIGLTVILLAYTFLRKETQGVRFSKLLAAHSFTWLGIQTMFVFTFAWFLQEFPVAESLLEGLSGEERENEIGRILGQQVGWSFFTLSAVAAILPAILLEPMAGKYGRMQVHRMCIASMAVGYILLPIVGMSPLMVYIMMAVLGIGWASTISLVFAIMTQMAQGSKMGLFMGIFNLSVVLPQLAVSLGVSKLINDAPNKDLIYWIAAAALGLSALLWYTIKPQEEVG